MLDLQVLKLRGTGLEDRHLLELVDALGIRLRLLDVRDNRLTGDAIVYLSNACFLPWERLLGEETVEDGTGGDSLIGVQSGPDFLSLDSLRHEDLGNKLFQQLTQPLTGRLALEDLPHKGLTHLYVSGNLIAYEDPRGLVRMLQANRIYVLDCGFLRTAQVRTARDHSSVLADAKNLRLCFTGNSSMSLTYLRVHFSILTASKSQEELDLSRPPMFDDEYLSSVPPAFVDPIPAPEYCMVHEKSSKEVRRDEEISALDPIPSSGLKAGSIISNPSITEDAESVGHHHHRSDVIAAQIGYLKAKRPSNQTASTDSTVDPIPLHPSHLPRLQTLVLSDVPSHEHGTFDIAHSIKKFIIACAEERYLADLQAQVNHSMPPGFPRGSRHGRYAESLFALQTIVLEVDPRLSASKPTNKAWDHSRAQQNMQRSSTEDVDSENLWAAAEHDFSFFGEGGEHSEEPPYDDSADKLKESNLNAHPSEEKPDIPPPDIIADLVTFRQERKSAHERALKEWREGKKDKKARGSGEEPFTPGHWKGAIKIVRT